MQLEHLIPFWDAQYPVMWTLGGEKAKATESAPSNAKRMEQKIMLDISVNEATGEG